MTNNNQKLNQLYTTAMNRLKDLAKKRQELVQERHSLVRGHIKQLEAQKIETIRASLGLPPNNN